MRRAYWKRKQRMKSAVLYADSAKWLDSVRRAGRLADMLTSGPRSEGTFQATLGKARQSPWEQSRVRFRREIERHCIILFSKMLAEERWVEGFVLAAEGVGECGVYGVLVRGNG